MGDPFDIPDVKTLSAETIAEINGLRTPMAQASFSRLEYYKNCPKAFEHKYVHRTKTLEAPQMKDRFGNVKQPAWQRGSVIHQAMDDYINDVRQDLIPELLDLKHEIEDAKELMKLNPARVLTEQNKYFDIDYNLIDMASLSEEDKSVTSGGDVCPKHYHVLIIIDLLIFNEDFTEAKVIDLKSGKMHHVKHQSQTQLYALFTAIEYPDVQKLTTQLWYCDQGGAIRAKEYSRENILIYLNFWSRRISLMHQDLTFRENPHEQTCMFCDYGQEKHSNKWVNKNGACSLSLDKRDRIA